MRLLRLAFLFCALCAIVGHAHAQGGMGPGPGTVHSTGGGGGTVTIDVLGTEKYQATSNSFSYTGLTTGSPTGLGLVCWLMRAHTTNDVSAGVAMTWNGTSMTLVKTQLISGFNIQGVFLFGLHNPTSGAQTLAISATNVATDNFVNCASFSNVNQTSDAAAFINPTGANSGLTGSVAVTSASGHMAIGGFLSSGSPLGTIIPTIAISDAVSGSILNVGADFVSSSGASTTVGTSATNQGAVAGMDVSN